MSAPARPTPADPLGTDRPAPRATTIADLVDQRSPGFDLLRLALALAVLVSHSWSLGGFGDEPGSPLAPTKLTLGGFAVAGFFALSGLLVGRSAARRPLGAFVRARAVRIVPGYAVAVVASAFGAAALGWIHEHGSLRGFVSLDGDGPFAYVGRALLFPVEMMHGVRDVFATSTPYGIARGESIVNGSLWTLPYEVRCYLVVGLVALVMHRWGERRTVLAAWLVTAVLAVGYREAPGFTTAVIGPVADQTLVMLLFVFLSGTLVGAHGSRIRVLGWVPATALVVALVCGRTSLFLSEHLGSASLALVLPPIAVLIAPLGAALRGVDLSYGAYLYAWPVQQLLAMYRVTTDVRVYLALSTAITLPLAAASWYAVERPSMRRWRPTR